MARMAQPERIPNGALKQKLKGPGKPEKETVRINDGVSEYEVNVNNLIKHLTALKARPEAMWINPSVRFIDTEYIEGPNGSYEEVHIVVTETPPGVRSVRMQRNFDKFQGELHEGDAIKFDLVQLSFPYVVNVFVFKEQDGTLVLDPTWALSFYRTLPLAGFSDELRVCNLPNATIEPWSEELAKATVGWTCFHNAPPEDVSTVIMEKNWKHQGESKNSAVSRLAQQVLDYYWTAIFTASEDTISAWKATSEKLPEVRTLKDWIQSTKDNPNFALEIEWLQHPELANLGEVVTALHDALGIVPHEGFAKGESPIIAPNGIVSLKRFRSAIEKGWPRKYKLY